MTTWQVLKQLRFLLRQATWPGSANLVFASDSVLVTRAVAARVATRLRFPAATLWPLGGTPDPRYKEEPGFVEKRIRVRLIVAHPDALGEAALLGANVPTPTLSAGHGLLEIEERLKATVRRLSLESGVHMLWRAEAGAEAVVEEESYIAYCQYDFVAYLTDSRSYAGATRITGSVAGANVTLGWKNPAARFDRRRMVVRRIAGSTPPAGPTDGTDVPLGGDFDETLTDTGVATGTWSYSVFAWYDDRVDPPASDIVASAPLSITMTVT